jgi:hypothetical protein
MKRWPIARYLFSSHLVIVPLFLIALYLACAVLLGVAAAVTEIRISVADIAGQVLPWFALGYGATASGLLATMLVHGRTRREFLRQHPVFVVVASVLLSGITTGVYAIEAMVYRAFDWPQKVQGSRIYETATDYGTIFMTYWSMYLFWLMVGVFLGVAFYRSEAIGVLALLPAGALAIAVGGVNGFFSLPFARTDLNVAAVTVVAVAIIWVLLWVTGRDVPVRSRVA